MSDNAGGSPTSRGGEGGDAPDGAGGDSGNDSGGVGGEGSGGEADATGGASDGSGAGAGGSGGTDGVGGSSGTGGTDGVGGSSGTGGSGGTGGTVPFSLTSPDHAEGAIFAEKYTCESGGFQESVLPELAWTAGPAGTMSYAVTFLDVTALESQSNAAYHWAIYNIPATTLGLPEEFENATSIGAIQISAAFGNAYLGPCPMGQQHDYEFTLYALPTTTVTITGTGTTGVKNATAVLEANALATTKLTGTSTASPP